MDYEQKYRMLVSFIRGINASVESAASIDLEIPAQEVMHEIIKEIKEIEGEQ